MASQEVVAKLSGIVTVLPLDAEISVLAGETLFEAAARLGYSWPTRCFGQAQCTLCALEVKGGADNAVAADAEEQSVVQRVQSMRGGGPYRLACRMQVSGPVVVRKDGVTRPVR
jgi:2Fe-2S ferredoxin